VRPAAAGPLAGPEAQKGAGAKSQRARTRRLSWVSSAAQPLFMLSLCYPTIGRKDGCFHSSTQAIARQ
jgi:hypothetical protein